MFRGGWKKKERPLERGRNCMIRYPSPQPSAHKKRLEKLLKHTAPPEKRLSFKESLLQQLAKMQKDANAGNLTFDPSAMEALGEWDVDCATHVLRCLFGITLALSLLQGNDQCFIPSARSRSKLSKFIKGYVGVAE